MSGPATNNPAAGSPTADSPTTTGPDSAGPGPVPAGTRRVLVLGGTGEARRLVTILADGGTTARLDVVYSLAGRVRAPALPPSGRVRTGGFGGIPGLVDYLRTEAIDAMVDATHPFAATMTAHAAAAARATGVPLLVLRRPGWREQPGDDWRRVPSLAAAAALLDRFVPARVFLTTGRTDLALFASLDRPWFLARSVEPPVGPVPPRLTVLLDRGPFDVTAEIDLLRRHRIDVVVTKDSGGTMTAAKLTAARDLGLPVVMVDRPPVPPDVEVVDDVATAVTSLLDRIR